MPKYIKTTSGHVYISPAADKINKIDRCMNFIWIGSDIPTEEARHIKMFQSLHPTWDIKVWRDADIFSLPITGELCRNTLPFAASIDLARLEIIYTHGGWYSDLDIEFYKNIDYLCSSGKKLILSSETIIREVLYSNGIFAAAPKNPLIKLLMERIIENISILQQKTIESSNVLNTTGPGVWAEVLSDYLPVPRLHHSYSSNGGMIIDVDTSEIIGHHKLNFSWKKS